MGLYNLGEHLGKYQLSQGHLCLLVGPVGGTMNGLDLSLYHPEWTPSPLVYGCLTFESAAWWPDTRRIYGGSRAQRVSCAPFRLCFRDNTFTQFSSKSPARTSGFLVYDSTWTPLTYSWNYYFSQLMLRNRHLPWRYALVSPTVVSAHLRHMAPSAPPDMMTVTGAPRSSASMASVRI